MPNRPPGLFDSFSHQGLFWLAGHRENEVPGRLCYDPDQGAVLELLGIFGTLEDAIQQAWSGADRDDRPVIHGVTVKGRPVTLLKTINTSRQINMPGIPCETWSSNLLVMGAHIQSADDDAQFSRCIFRFQEIEAWLEHAPFTEDFDSEARSLSLLAEAPRNEPFATHAAFEVRSVGSLYSDRTAGTRFTVDVSNDLAITSVTPQTLGWHLSRAVRLQELASLCSGHYLPLTAFELRGPVLPDETGPGDEIQVYAQMIHGRAETPSKLRTPIITGWELMRFNPDAVQLWFDQFELFSPALNLFFTITGEKQMFVNIRLLLAIQALEVFHRRTSGDTVMAAQDFIAFADGLVAAIPDDAPARMREKLGGLYRFANEPSLNQRLRAIIAEVATAFGQAPAGFDGKFIRKLVDTRNYYTHFSAELGPRALDGEGMYWATRRVILLLTILFLQRLAISAADIKPLLQRHREFAQLWASAERPC